MILQGECWADCAWFYLGVYPWTVAIPPGLSRRVSGTLVGTDKSRWTTATALLGFAATVNPLAEMPPQNDPWLGGREGAVPVGTACASMGSEIHVPAEPGTGAPK
jgi:hypothetical protein